ncbi:MAG: hypothetical protein QOJ37_366, partial [Pseudonocardiales bacterium]|nr:hypothetical protein [Pseudonocardiales bacterium]
MRRTPRRWLIALVVVAASSTGLVAASEGVGAPSGDLMSTKVSGVDVDATTIPQLQ